jgi:hypothetical protein
LPVLAALTVTTTERLCLAVEKELEILVAKAIVLICSFRANREGYIPSYEVDDNHQMKMVCIWMGSTPVAH